MFSSEKKINKIIMILCVDFRLMICKQNRLIYKTYKTKLYLKTRRAKLDSQVLCAFDPMGSAMNSPTPLYTIQFFS